MTPVFSTADTIFNQVRAETKVGSNPVATALQNTAMLRKLHDLNEQFVNYPYSVGMLGFKFLNRETTIQTKNHTTLNGAISSGASSFIVTDGTDFDSPSSDVAGFYIKNSNNIYDFGTYESKSTHTLSTVSGIQIAHSASEEVHKIYRLPSDYGKPRALYRESNVIEYEYLDADFRQVPPYGYYMVKTLYGTNHTGDFMVFPEDVGEIDWKFYYIKRPNTIDGTDDQIDAPNGNGRQWIIEKMNAYVYSVLGETDLANRAEQQAAYCMDRCLAEFATHTVQSNQSLSLYW